MFERWRQENFFTYLREEVLADVGRAQWVFSIPKMLRPYVLYHRPLLGWLCRAAYETAREMIGAALPAQERARLLLSWRHSGFSVHTSVTVPPGDGEGLERLARYLLRPPVSLERLHLDEPARTIAYARRPGQGSAILPSPSSSPSAPPQAFNDSLRPRTAPTKALTKPATAVSSPKVKMKRFVCL